MLPIVNSRTWTFNHHVILTTKTATLRRLTPVKGRYYVYGGLQPSVWATGVGASVGDEDVLRRKDSSPRFKDVWNHLFIEGVCEEG